MSRTTLKTWPLLGVIALVAGFLAVMGVPGVVLDGDDDTLTATVAAFSNGATIEKQQVECGTETEFLAGEDTQQGNALNPLQDTAPNGVIAVIEPNTTTHRAIWRSEPTTAPIVLCAGDVTIELVMMNIQENEEGGFFPPDQDICWDKHWHLPNGDLVPIVDRTCFENPLPAQGFFPEGPCPISDPPPAPGPCQDVAGFVTNTQPSLILVETVIPAGSFKEVTISCPGSSFIGVFFNNGLDVVGDPELDFSKITEPVKVPVEGDQEIGIYLLTPTPFDFVINYMGDQAALVVDTVPAEFEVLSVATSAGATNVFQTGKSGKSATRIEWDAPALVVTLSLTSAKSQNQ